jgi:hypothetical protein
MIPLGLLAILLSMPSSPVEARTQMSASCLSTLQKHETTKLDEPDNKQRYDEPETQNPHGPNPHGPNPHGRDPHDENHDKDLPANNNDKYWK